jgi:hypothetical protein
MGLGHNDAAAADFDAALRIARQHDHWMRGVILTNVADLQVRENDIAAASATVAAARTALEQAFPPDTRADEGWRFDLLGSVEGAVLDAQGQHERARPLLDQGVAALAQRFGESSTFAVDAMRRSERHFVAVGDAAGARAARRRLDQAMSPAGGLPGAP